MSNVRRRKLDNPVQTKSLEQIFPEDINEHGDTVVANASIAHSSPQSQLLSPQRRGETIGQEFIDVEKEMIPELITPEEVSVEKEAVKSPESKPSSFSNDDANTLITAPRPLRKSEFTDFGSSEYNDRVATSNTSKLFYNLCLFLFLFARVLEHTLLF